MLFVIDAETTPGCSLSCVRKRSQNACRLYVESYDGPLSVTRIVNRLLESNPGFTLCMPRKLRMSSAAPTSSTSDSATSPTTRLLRKRWRARPALVPREPPSRNVSFEFGRAD